MRIRRSKKVSKQKSKIKKLKNKNNLEPKPLEDTIFV